jgi:hypothetical protein
VEIAKDIKGVKSVNAKSVDLGALAANNDD